METTAPVVCKLNKTVKRTKCDMHKVTFGLKCGNRRHFFLTFYALLCMCWVRRLMVFWEKHEDKLIIIINNCFWLNVVSEWDKWTQCACACDVSAVETPSELMPEAKSMEVGFGELNFSSLWITMCWISNITAKLQTILQPTFVYKHAY